MKIFLGLVLVFCGMLGLVIVPFIRGSKRGSKGVVVPALVADTTPAPAIPTFPVFPIGQAVKFVARSGRRLTGRVVGRDGGSVLLRRRGHNHGPVFRRSVERLG